MTRAINKEIKRLQNRPLSEIRARFTELTGETNRSPNKVFLLRRIREALEAQHAAAAPAANGERAETDGDGGRQSNRGDGLSKMTIEELRSKYLEVVGRPTGSDNRGYLIWKIRMARGGKVRVGPARERSAEAADLQHVPFTLPRETVAELDAARTRLGFKSRQAMLHQAMHELLVARGERDVAQHFKAGA
jgi:hypothetical protein